MIRPFISVNMAISLDGKISTHCYTPARFSTKADFKKLLELRCNADAVLVGKKTLEADSMRLTVPDQVLAGRKPPLRCVVSKTGIWDQSHVLFEASSNDNVANTETLLFTIGNKSQEVENATSIKMSSLEATLNFLVEKGVRRLHCEGGGNLLKQLFKLDCVDELNITWVGSKCFGGEGAPTISGEIGEYLSSTLHYKLIDFEVGEDGECFLKYSR